MKQWKRGIATIAVMAGLLVPVLTASPVQAVNVFEQCKGDSSAVCKAQGTDDATNMMGIIINILLFIIGIIAVIMIIVGGIRYSLSNGNSSQLKEAKDTILYAVIGLIIAIMSYGIVNFVLGYF